MQINEVFNLQIDYASFIVCGQPKVSSIAKDSFPSSRTITYLCRRTAIDISAVEHCDDDIAFFYGQYVVAPDDVVDFTPGIFFLLPVGKREDGTDNFERSQNPRIANFEPEFDQ